RLRGPACRVLANRVAPERNASGGALFRGSVVQTKEHAGLLQWDQAPPDLAFLRPRAVERTARRHRADGSRRGGRARTRWRNILAELPNFRQTQCQRIARMAAVVLSRLK